MLITMLKMSTTPYKNKGQVKNGKSIANYYFSAEDNLKLFVTIITICNNMNVNGFTALFYFF